MEPHDSGIWPIANTGQPPDIPQVLVYTMSRRRSKGTDMPDTELTLLKPITLIK
jgi:hypothetical protein